MKVQYLPPNGSKSSGGNVLSCCPSVVSTTEFSHHHDDKTFLLHLNRYLAPFGFSQCSPTDLHCRQTSVGWRVLFSVTEYKGTMCLLLPSACQFVYFYTIIGSQKHYWYMNSGNTHKTTNQFPGSFTWLLPWKEKRHTVVVIWKVDFETNAIYSCLFMCVCVCE